MNERMTEQILSEARSSLEPTKADRERVHKKVLAAIGAAGAVTVASGTAANATGGLSAGSLIAGSTIVKIGAGMLVVGGIVGMLAYWSGSSTDETPTEAETAVVDNRETPASADEPEAPPPVDQTPALQPTAQPTAQPAPAEIAEPEPTETVKKPPKRRARKMTEKTPQAPDEPVSKPNDNALLKEISLIKKASRALNQKQPQKTLQILDEYDATFPAGVMREERNGLRVLALCDLGRHAEALKAKRQFLRRSPSSPMASRIQERCKLTEETHE